MYRLKASQKMEAILPLKLFFFAKYKVFEILALGKFLMFSVFS